jgi:hypothetical protein
VSVEALGGYPGCPAADADFGWLSSTTSQSPRSTRQAEGRFRRWLAEDVLPHEFGPSVLDEVLSGWLARSRVTRMGAYRIGRTMRSAQAKYDDTALQRVTKRLNIGMRERLGAPLADDDDGAIPPSGCRSRR